MADREPAHSATACTLVAEGRLAAALVLARSYRRAHPDHRFVVFVVDRDAGAAEYEDFVVAGYRWLGADVDEYLRLATAFAEDELIPAVTPLVLREALAGSEVAAYVSAESQVLAPFGEVTEKAARQGIVLVPHTLRPLPDDGFEPARAKVVFDPGFVAVGPSALSFLDYWADGARRRKPGRARNWLDTVPGLFPHHVVRDPGIGAGYWNLHEDERATGLRLVHFTGYRIDRPWLLSTPCADRPRIQLSAEPAVRELCEQYRELLTAAGHVEDADRVPAFGELADGTTVTRAMRRAFHTEWLAFAEQDRLPFGKLVEELPPHAFGADGGREFRQWLAAPANPVDRAAGLNRLVACVWAYRIDLQAVFPHPRHGDAAGFREWCRRHGTEEGLVPGWAAPLDPPAPRPPEDRFGVNIAGYLTGELGLGEMGRIVHRTVREAGIPVASVVEEHSLTGACRTGLDQPETTGRPVFPVSVLAVNADYTRLVLDSHPEVGHQRYRIGLWAWELEDFPVAQHDGFGLVDEVWTISEFCRRAIEPHSPVPVKVIPVPVRDPGEPRRAPRPAGAPTRFLFAFDFNSTGQRKNPWGLVEAFKLAFPDRDDVRLTIKTTNEHLHLAARERVLHAIGGDPRIELLNRYLSVAELDELYATSDAYVSLHRSEGFGLTVAEAMVRGMPVIATDYSSTTEFFDASVGWPISCTMTEVGPGWVPYQPEGRWADPDLAKAARAMRQVADEPSEAMRRGKAAREHILRTRSTAAAAQWMDEQLRAAYEKWRAGHADGRHADPVLQPLDDAREALHWEADPSSRSRLPFAPALRKLVRRAIDHYDAHQRQVLGTLTDGTRQSMALLAQEQQRLAERLERLERN